MPNNAQTITPTKTKGAAAPPKPDLKLERIVTDAVRAVEAALDSVPEAARGIYIKEVIKTLAATPYGCA